MELLLFIETFAFQATREAFLDDEEFALLQQFLLQHPTAGSIVPESGGVRKLRWRGSGRGNAVASASSTISPHAADKFGC